MSELTTPDQTQLAPAPETQVQAQPIDDLFNNLAKNSPELREHGLDAFKDDMKDENNLKGLYDNLSAKNQQIRDHGYDNFKSDMWGSAPDITGKDQSVGQPEYKPAENQVAPLEGTATNPSKEKEPLHLGLDFFKSNPIEYINQAGRDFAGSAAYGAQEFAKGAQIGLTEMGRNVNNIGHWIGEHGGNPNTAEQEKQYQENDAKLTAKLKQLNIEKAAITPYVPLVQWAGYTGGTAPYVAAVAAQCVTGSAAVGFGSKILFGLSGISEASETIDKHDKDTNQKSSEVTKALAEGLYGLIYTAPISEGLQKGLGWAAEKTGLTKGAGWVADKIFGKEVINKIANGDATTVALRSFIQQSPQTNRQIIINNAASYAKSIAGMETLMEGKNVVDELVIGDSVPAKKWREDFGGAIIAGITFHTMSMPFTNYATDRAMAKLIDRGEFVNLTFDNKNRSVIVMPFDASDVPSGLTVNADGSIIPLYKERKEKYTGMLPNGEIVELTKEQATSAMPVPKETFKEAIKGYGQSSKLSKQPAPIPEVKPIDPRSIAEQQARDFHKTIADPETGIVQTITIATPGTDTDNLTKYVVRQWDEPGATPGTVSKKVIDQDGVAHTIGEGVSLNNDVRTADDYVNEQLGNFDQSEQTKELLTKQNKLNYNGLTYTLTGDGDEATDSYDAKINVQDQNEKPIPIPASVIDGILNLNSEFQPGVKPVTAQTPRVAKVVSADHAQLDKDISDAQKRLGIEQTPPVNISNNTELTLDKIDRGEPVTNEYLKAASDELYSNYKMLEAMKKSDQRTHTLEQIESMQEYLGEEITNLENHANKQTEKGEFITKDEVGNVAQAGAAEDNRQPQDESDPLGTDGKPLQETPIVSGEENTGTRQQDATTLSTSADVPGPAYSLNGQEITKEEAHKRVNKAILLDDKSKLNGLAHSDQEITDKIEKKWPKPPAVFKVKGKKINPKDALDFIEVADDMSELNELKHENIDSEPAVKEALEKRKAELAPQPKTIFPKALTEGEFYTWAAQNHKDPEIRKKATDALNRQGGDTDVTKQYDIYKANYRMGDDYISRNKLTENVNNPISKPENVSEKQNQDTGNEPIEKPEGDQSLQKKEELQNKREESLPKEATLTEIFTHNNTNHGGTNTIYSQGDKYFELPGTVAGKMKEISQEEVIRLLWNKEHRGFVPPMNEADQTRIKNELISLRPNEKPITPQGENQGNTSGGKEIQNPAQKEQGQGEQKGLEENVVEPWKITKAEFEERSANDEDLIGWYDSPAYKEASELAKESDRQQALGTKESKVKAKELELQANMIGQQWYEDHTHEIQVAQALKEGKPVPPEVLADYPELQTLKSQSNGQEVQAKGKTKEVVAVISRYVPSRSNERAIKNDVGIEIAAKEKDSGAFVKTFEKDTEDSEGSFSFDSELIHVGKKIDTSKPYFVAYFGDVRGNRYERAVIGQSLADVINLVKVWDMQEVMMQTINPKTGLKQSFTAYPLANQYEEKTLIDATIPEEQIVAPVQETPAPVIPPPAVPTFDEWFSKIRFYKSGGIDSYELPDGTKGIGKKDLVGWFEKQYAKRFPNATLPNTSEQPINKTIKVPKLDASYIVTEIDPESDHWKRGFKYEVSYSIPESLGEQGSTSDGYYYPEYPTEKEINEDILDSLKLELENTRGSNSARDERIFEAVNKVLNPEVDASKPVKEPWQMTQREYVEDRIKNHGVRARYSAGSRLMHEDDVKQALKEGKPVPPEVLADYPELQPKENKDKLESRLEEERKQRILLEGTGFDKEFGLLPVKNIKSADDIISNINKILSILKVNEGNGRYKDFEGFSYGGKYAKNAGEQVREYFIALDVLPNELRKEFAEKINITTHKQLSDWAGKKYDELKVPEELKTLNPQSNGQEVQAEGKTKEVVAGQEAASSEVVPIEATTVKSVTSELKKEQKDNSPQVFKEQKKQLLDDLTRIEDILLGENIELAHKNEKEFKESGWKQDKIDNLISGMYDEKTLTPEQLSELEKLGVKVIDGGRNFQIDVYKDGTVNVGDVRTAMRIVNKGFPANPKEYGKINFTNSPKARETAEGLKSKEQADKMVEFAESNLAEAQKSGLKGMIETMKNQLAQAKEVQSHAQHFDYEEKNARNERRSNPGFVKFFDKKNTRYLIGEYHLNEKQIYDIYNKYKLDPDNESTTYLEPYLLADKLSKSGKTIDQEIESLQATRDRNRNYNSEKKYTKSNKGRQEAQRDAWSIENEDKRISQLKGIKYVVDKIINSQIPDRSKPLTEVLAEGSRKVEEKKNIPVVLNSPSEIKDDYFLHSLRPVILPSLPKSTLDIMGVESKPVLIRRNIFTKNRNSHKELTPEDSRNILSDALYNNDVIALGKAKTKPDYWVAIKNGNKHSVIVIDVTETKDNHEIVGWRLIDERAMSQLKNQVEREGGLFLITSKGAAGLSALPSDLEGKDNAIPSESQELGKNNIESPIVARANEIISGNVSRRLADLSDLIAHSKSPSDLKKLLEVPFIKTNIDLPKEIHLALNYLERHPDLIEEPVKESGQPKDSGSELSKEAWEMSLKEFIKNQRNELGDQYQVAFETGGENGKGVIGEHHKKIIQKAISEGKSVPQSVLDEYPELRNKDELVSDEQSKVITSQNKELPLSDLLQEAKKIINEKKETLQDFGEKVGGAKKDLGITRTVRDTDSLPAWRRKYDFANADGTIVIGQKIDTSKPFIAQYAQEYSMWGRKSTRYVIVTEVKDGYITREPKVFTSEEEAENYIPVFEVIRQGYKITKSGDGVVIYKKASTGKALEFDKFPTKEEAQVYLNSTEGATSLLNRKREDFSIPNLDKAERTGKDYRKGKDVSEQEFADKFGFRGGEFGNWVKPEERRTLLNLAYDSLMDLSEVLNLPPKAISLNGNLSIAFGARGSGGAKAHYEGDRAVINLTRLNGVGSLAHEWMHALDNYFGLQDAGKGYEKNEKGEMKHSGMFFSEIDALKPAMRSELRDILNDIVDNLQKKTVTRQMGVEERQLQFDKLSKNLISEGDHLLKKFENGVRRHVYNRKTKVREDVVVKATPEQLSKAKELVDKILNGESTRPEWGPVTSGNYTYSSPDLISLDAIHKEVFGSTGLKRDGNGFYNMGYYGNRFYDAKAQLDKAVNGEMETVKIDTDFYKHSKEFDKTRVEPYWQKKLEMLARSFEQFVVGKLEEKGIKSDYLQYDKMPIYKALYEISPYPDGEERVVLNNLFQKLFDNIKTEEHGDNIPMFSIIGEKGASKVEGLIDNLTIAKEMAGEGKDPKAIFLATGWEKFPDGWKYDKVDDLTARPYVNIFQFSNAVKAQKEIDKLNSEKDYSTDREHLIETLKDFYSASGQNFWSADQDSHNAVTEALRNSDQSLLPKPSIEQTIKYRNQSFAGKAKLFDIIADNELFKMYPELKNVTVSFQDTQKNRGTYSHSAKSIELSRELKGSESEVRSTLSHEIQHAIQNIEGFAKGGNLRQFENINIKWVDSVIDSAKKLIEERVDVLGKREYYDTLFDGTEEGMKKYDEFMQSDPELTQLSKELNEWNTKRRNAKNPFAAYRKLAGETESRNVQSRLNLTSEERRQQMLSETQDVAEDQKIYLQGEIERAYSVFGLEDAASVIEHLEVNSAFASDIQYKTIDEFLNNIGNRLTPEEKERVKNTDYDATSFNNDIIFNSEKNQSVNDVITNWAHEKSHIQLFRNFNKDINKKEKYFSDLYKRVGADEVRRVIPKDYWKDDFGIQGEEYLVHLATIYATSGTISSEVRPEIRKEVENLINSFTSLKNIQDARQEKTRTKVQSKNEGRNSDAHKRDTGGIRQGTADNGGEGLQPDGGLPNYAKGEGGINLKNLQDVINTSIAGQANDSRQQSTRKGQGRFAIDDTQRDKLDPGTEEPLPSGSRGMGQQSSESSGNGQEGEYSLDRETTGIDAKRPYDNTSLQPGNATGGSDVGSNDGTGRKEGDRISTDGKSNIDTGLRQNEVREGGINFKNLQDVTRKIAENLPVVQLRENAYNIPGESKYSVDRSIPLTDFLKQSKVPKKGDTIKVKEGSVYGGQDMPWSEPFTGHKIIGMGGEWVVHQSSKPIKSFAPKKIAVHPSEYSDSYFKSNITKEDIKGKYSWETYVYSIYLPEGKQVETFGNDEYRFDLNESDRVIFSGIVYETKGEPKIGSDNRPIDIYLKYSDTINPSIPQQSKHKQSQLDIILASNPMSDDIHTGIRSIKDVKTAEEVFAESLRDNEDATPDFTVSNMKAALETKSVTMYSSFPIKNGTFVSPSKMQAEAYSGDKKVYSKKVDVSDVAWIDQFEGQYANVNEEKGNRGTFYPESNNIRFSVAKPTDVEELKQPDEETKSKVRRFLPGESKVDYHKRIGNTVEEKPMKEVGAEAENKWIGNRDVENTKANVEATRQQDEIKKSFTKGGGAKSWQDVDKGIHLYSELGEDIHNNDIVGWDRRSEYEKGLIDVARNLNPRQKEIANEIRAQYDKLGQEAYNEGAINNVLDDYVGHIWNLKGKTTPQEFNSKFATKTGHAKQRILSNIIEGWDRGMSLRIEGATTNLMVVKTEVHNAIEGKKLVSEGLKTYDENGAPLFTTYAGLPGYKKIEHYNFTKWEEVKKVNNVSSKPLKGENVVITEEGRVLVKSPIYAPAEIADKLNTILGSSKLSGEAWKALSTFNSTVKSVQLSYSFFHHMAFMRNFFLTTNFENLGQINIRQSYKNGLKMAHEFTPEVELLVRNWMTLGRMQEFDELGLESKSTFGAWMDKHGILPSAHEFLNEMNQNHHDFLFKKFGVGLKVQAGVIELRRLMKKHPEIDPNELARAVGDMMGQQYGGMNLDRQHRSKTGQYVGRLMILAADWTESNFRAISKLFHFDYSKAEGKWTTSDFWKSGYNAVPKFEHEMYQKMWANVLLRTTAITLATNLAMAFFNDPDKEEEYWQTVERMYKDAFVEPWKLHFLQPNISPIYHLMGGNAKKQQYFNLLGQFEDGVRMIYDLVGFAKNKASVISKIGLDALTGSNWQGKRYTSLLEFIGKDDKGMYSVSNKKKDIHVGDPKGGKLTGELTKYDPMAGLKPIQYSQLPSFLMETMRSMLPVPAQNITTLAQGEISGWDAVTRGIGIKMTSSTSKTSDYSGQANELLKNADIYVKVKREAAHNGDRQLLDKIDNTEWIQASKRIDGHYKGQIDKYKNQITHFTEKNESDKVEEAQKNLDDVYKQMVDEFKDVKFPSKYR